MRTHRLALTALLLAGCSVGPSYQRPTTPPVDAFRYADVKEAVHAGKPPVEAALYAAKLRLRPILMTAFAFILGVLPLVRAAGAGAESRKVMGMAVFAGMLVATLLAVVLVPVLFVTVERLFGGKPTGAPPPPEKAVPAAGGHP